MCRTLIPAGGTRWGHRGHGFLLCSRLHQRLHRADRDRGHLRRGARFPEARSKNAAITLVTLGVLLTTMFLGISFLADHLACTFLDRDGDFAVRAHHLWQRAHRRGVFYAMGARR